jgi:hypothetical protein
LLPIAVAPLIAFPFVINFLQAAAAAYVFGRPDILTAAQNGDSALVFFHLVVNSDDVNKRDDW